MMIWGLSRLFGQEIKIIYAIRTKFLVRKMDLNIILHYVQI